MTDRDETPNVSETLSEAARHALAINKLAGFEPSAEFLENLALLDAGVIDTDEAIRRSLERIVGDEKPPSGPPN